jgi:hypothetical protein
MTCVPTPKGSSRLSLNKNEMTKMATGVSQTGSEMLTADYLSDFADSALF